MPQLFQQAADAESATLATDTAVLPNGSF
jgi:hypothetical protein